MIVIEQRLFSIDHNFSTSFIFIKFRFPMAPTLFRAGIRAVSPRTVDTTLCRTRVQRCAVAVNGEQRDRNRSNERLN